MGSNPGSCWNALGANDGCWAKGCGFYNSDLTELIEAYIGSVYIHRSSSTPLLQERVCHVKSHRSVQIAGVVAMEPVIARVVSIKAVRLVHKG